MSSPPDKLGTPVAAGPRTWVQTERAAHEAWGDLTMRSPRAAAVMHKLVALMGHQNAVVVSQKTLAKLLRCNTRTVQRALDDLVKGKWVQVVQVGASGTINAYVVNSAVAWGEKREHIARLSVFHATVVADAEDQPEGTLERTDLRRIPVIVPPEGAIPDGEGEAGAQIALPGLEPVIEGGASVELPAIPEQFERAVAAAIARSDPPALPTEPPSTEIPDAQATLDRIRRESAARLERERREAAERQRRAEAHRDLPVIDDSKD